MLFAPTLAVAPSPLVGGSQLGASASQLFWHFGVSVYSALQVEALHPLSPLTTTINYGVMTNDGTVAVRIIYDYRVLNGGMVGRMLVRPGADTQFDSTERSPSAAVLTGWVTDMHAVATARSCMSSARRSVPPRLSEKY